jgi:hypothetical protein
MDLTMMERVGDRWEKMEVSCSTGQNPQWAVVPVEEEDFEDNRHMKVVRLSVLHIGRLYPPGNIPGTHFFNRLCCRQGHNAAGRIMTMKNSNDTIGNRTHELPACSAVTYVEKLKKNS